MKRAAKRLSMLSIGALLCARLVCAGVYHWTQLGPFDADGAPIACQSIAASPDGSTLYAGVDSAVYRTDDGGQHWTRLGVPTPGGVFKLLLSGSSLFAATATGVFLSSDRAETWTASGLAGLTVFTLAVDPRDPGTLHAGTWTLDAPGLVFKSIDRGATWDPTYSLDSDWVVSLAVDQFDSATLFAGSRYGLILSSADAGSTWTSAESGVSVVESFAFDDQEPSRVFASGHQSVGPGYYPQFGAVLKSEDRGKSWKPVAQLPRYNVGLLAVDPSSPGAVYAEAGESLWRSIDGGQSWAALATASGALDFVVLPGSPPTLLAAGYGGVSRLLLPLPGSCVPDATTLCLKDGRFRVTVGWQRTPLGPTGQAHAVPVTSDSGYFWFLDADNVELMVKVLDGRPVNGSFWVFYGSLTGLSCTITVTDTATGESRDYVKAPGALSSGADTHAFPQTDAGTVSESSGAAPGPSGSLPASPTEVCEPGSRTLCLNEGRFQVQVVWQVSPSGPVGTGQTVPLTDDTGAFWFLDPANIELVVKVLDGRTVNGHFWVFYGSLSSLEFLITVTDTATGAVRTYHNPRGTLEGGADTAAF